MQILLIYLMAGLAALLVSGCATTARQMNCDKVAAGGTEKAQREAFQCVLDRNLNDKAYTCFKSAAHITPNLRGELMAYWTILTTGETVDVLIEPASTPQDFKVCLAEAVRSLKFPERESRVKASYKFQFRAGENHLFGD